MLAIVSTHPIQYQTPIWRLLAERGRVPFKVFFLSHQGQGGSYDSDFGRSVQWDIDLLSGYDYEFVDVAVGKRQSSFWWLRLNENFGQRLKLSGAEVIWVQGWQVAAYWQLVWQAKTAGIHTWLRGETNLRSSRGGWRRHVRDFAVKQFLMRIDEFLCVGQANKEFYLSHQLHPSQLHSAPYCIDNNRFFTQAKRFQLDRKVIRTNWSIPQDSECILFAGKLTHKKRPLDLIRAAEILKSGSPSRKIHLLFVGTGELLDHLRLACRAVHDFENTIKEGSSVTGSSVSASFVGFLNQSEMAKAYVAADCLALPSEATETWGLVVNEAMACGLPAVTSDAVGCSDDLIKPVRPDLCFPVGDITMFAESLDACLKRPPSADDLRKLIDGYDVLRTVEAVERLYEASQQKKLPVSRVVEI